MASKKNNLSVDELHERWRHQIYWIGQEANFDLGHRIRYRLIEKWLFRSGTTAWRNRHMQAYGWISRLWINEGLMSVRRQLDDQYGSVSLKHLLHEIEAHPDVHLGVSAPEVAADRRILEDACAAALQFAQRQLAHRVPWNDPYISMGDLDAALDAIDRITHKYYLTITGEKLEVTEREPDPNWLRSFEVAWHKSRKSRRR